MKKKSYFAMLMIISLLAIAACSNDENGPDVAPAYNPGTIELSAVQQQMSNNANSFAWNMMSAERSLANGKSLVVSPLSMVYCLGMINTGAEGTTSDEITSTLGFNAGVEDINQYCRILLDEMPKLDSRTTMKIANCVEVNKPYELLSSYVKSITDSYDALVENRDFAESGFKDYLNRWVSDRTNNMIPQLFDRINPDAVAYIINALYFKGQWTERFDKQNTESMSFTKSDGSPKQVDMMNQTEDFKYYDDDTFQALGMNYGNGSYSMQVLLPQSGKTLDDVIKAIQERDWKSFVDEMSIYEVAVRLPRFSIEYGGEKTELLQDLGIKQMFTAKADFSKFSKVSVYVSNVVQKAKIEVDEEGTTAAAATYGEMDLMSPGGSTRKHFYANHPFIFVITEYSTGTICFLGQYTGE